MASVKAVAIFALVFLLACSQSLAIDDQELLTGGQVQPSEAENQQPAGVSKPSSIPKSKYSDRDNKKDKKKIFGKQRIIVRYTACTGLINQHYSHIAAFSLSHVLGAELVLPPAVKRDSFEHYFSPFAEQNEVLWTPDHLRSLLDVDKIIKHWKGKGLILHETPSLTPFPSLAQPDIAFPMYNASDINPDLVVKMGDVYQRNLDMRELVEMSRRTVVRHARSYLAKNKTSKLDYVVLDLPCTFFMLRCASKMKLVTEVTRSLHFSPPLWDLANKVIQGMSIATGGSDEYNGIHLRIEKDARDWAEILGGAERVWDGYLAAMQQAQFTKDVVLYTASGLLTYGATSELTNVITRLKSHDFCSEVYYKELYLEKEVLDELTSEQKALVDFLVLSKSRRFVGFGSSTFSFFLREYRALDDIPRSSSVLVDASAVGTNTLFKSAGRVL